MTRLLVHPGWETPDGLDACLAKNRKDYVQSLIRGTAMTT